jgi:invasion protein IalB
MVRNVTFAAIFALVAPAAALAQTPTAVATYKDWSVFVRDGDGEKICFAASEASDKSPKSVNHGDVFFLVATWASGAAAEQPSLMTGYAIDLKPEPAIRIGSDKWDMYSSENEAFIESKDEEQRLLRAMRRGADMRVSAVSTRGTATSYVVSLRGVTAALERVKKECG